MMICFLTECFFFRLLFDTFYRYTLYTLSMNDLLVTDVSFDIVFVVSAICCIYFFSYICVQFVCMCVRGMGGRTDGWMGLSVVGLFLYIFLSFHIFFYSTISSSYLLSLFISPPFHSLSSHIPSLIPTPLSYRLHLHINLSTFTCVLNHRFHLLYFFLFITLREHSNLTIPYHIIIYLPSTVSSLLLNSTPNNS